jgi:hypothetical protein
MKQATLRTFWSDILGSELANLMALCGCLKGETPSNPNWDAIVPLANRTLTTPSLANRLLGNDGLSSDLAEFLRVIKVRTLLRNQMMFAQLTEAVDALSNSGIRPMLFKGAAFIALGGKTYDDRVFGDLDLMVADEHAAGTIETLEAIGYRCFGSGSSASRWDDPKLCREIDAGGIDLRFWLKLPRPGYSYADLVPECRELSLGNGTVWLPSPTIQAVSLVMHDQLQEKDYWRGLIDLRHLFDMRSLLDMQGGVEWEKLIGFFPPGHARRALHTQLLTLSVLFDLPVPIGSKRNMTARLQLCRRQVQLRFKWLAPCCTLLALLLDPPLDLNSKALAKSRKETWSMSVWDRLRVLRRMFLAPKPTKV